MKKVLPLIIIAVFAIGKLAAQSVQSIPDGGFGSWNTPNWSDPLGYETSNSQTITKSTGGTANVVEVTGWTQGVNGVQLTTELTNGDTSVGYITNSLGNPLQGLGGIPYNQKPTGIEIWYNCNEAVGDSGLFGVFFKQGGVVQAAYLYTVTGTHTGYPALSETFNPALTFTPDTVIFAAVSSSSAIRNGNGFPGSTFTLSGVTFLGASQQPAALNGNFVNWVSDTAYSPQGWTASYPGVTRTTDAYTGNPYALELKTVFNPSNNSNSAQEAFATTGINTNNGVIGGYPYTGSQDTLEFYYEYTPATGNSTDSGNVSLEFKSGTNTFFTGMNLPAASTYTLVKLSFNLQSFIADSVIVGFSSSVSNSGNPPLADTGSTLRVDNVHFASQQLSTGIKPVLLANNSILLYPNPASNQVTIGSNQLAINEVRLDNILGQTVIDKNYANGVAGLKENIDVSSLADGLYFVTIISGNTTSIGKIMVTR